MGDCCSRKPPGKEGKGYYDSFDWRVVALMSDPVDDGMRTMCTVRMLIVQDASQKWH